MAQAIECFESEIPHQTVAINDAVNDARDDDFGEGHILAYLSNHGDLKKGDQVGEETLRAIEAEFTPVLSALEKRNEKITATAKHLVRGTFLITIKVVVPPSKGKPK